jgi:hypothetical protein
MGAVSAHEADSSFAVPERHEVFAEEANLNRRAVRLRHFPGKESRDPVAAHQISHRRAGAYACELFVEVVSKHESS